MADKLRMVAEDPQLQELVKQHFEANPSEREPYEAFLAAFNAKADALYPDFQEIWAAAESDGRIVRALAIHCVLRIRARSDLDEFERFKAKTPEADFVTSFDEVTASPNAAAAFRMTLAFYELMRIAKLDPDEMEELRRKVVKNSALKAAHTPKKKGRRHVYAKKLALAIAKDNPGFSYPQIVEEIPNRWALKGFVCFSPGWLKKLVPQWIAPRPPSTQRRTYPLRRYRRL